MLQAGAGQNPARQSAVGAGIPLTVPAVTLNAVCLSGIEAIAMAARLVVSGEARIVVAVGQESMSLAPHVLPRSRTGVRYGAMEMLDTMEHDGLSDAFEARSMGASTEAYGEPLAHHPPGAGRVRGGIAPPARGVRGLSRRRDRAVHGARPTRRHVVDADDGLRPDTTVESLARLEPRRSRPTARSRRATPRRSRTAPRRS